MKREPHPSLEYDAFSNTVDRVLSVPHDVFKKQVEEDGNRAAASTYRDGRYA